MPEYNLTDIIFWTVFLIALTYLSREIDTFRITKEIEKYIQIYKGARDRALSATMNSFREFAAKTNSMVDLRALEERVQQLIEITFIEPESRDPYGVISKLKHLIGVEDLSLTQDVKNLLPSIDENSLENLKDLISATRTLNLIYKIINHYYRLAKKFKSLWLLLQVQSLLPFISEEVSALEKALSAFKNGYPIGDSAGSLTVIKFAYKRLREGIRSVKIAKNTSLIEVPFEGRRILVVKASGPSGVVGHPDDALDYILKREKVKLIMTVDAALKFEGEESGFIAEGIGVAIGGLGVEKFNIEKLATENNIPLYAFLIKMSETEALSIMTKEISYATDKAVERIEKIIRERTKERDVVVLMGIGNTIGVYP